MTLVARPVQNLVGRRDFPRHQIMAFGPFQQFGRATKAADNRSSRESLGGSNRELPPLWRTRMTERKGLANRFRIIAGVIEVKRITLILLPHLPVGCEEIRRSVGFPVWR